MVSFKGTTAFTANTRSFSTEQQQEKLPSFNLSPLLNYLVLKKSNLNMGGCNLKVWNLCNLTLLLKLVGLLGPIGTHKERGFHSICLGQSGGLRGWSQTSTQVASFRLSPKRINIWKARKAKTRWVIFQGVDLATERNVLFGGGRC